MGADAVAEFTMNRRIPKLVGGGGGFGGRWRRVFVELAGGHAFVGGEGLVLAFGLGGREFLLNMLDGFVNGGSVPRRRSGPWGTRREAIQERLLASLGMTGLR